MPCSYPAIKTADFRSLNHTIASIARDVCYLMSQGGGSGVTSVSGTTDRVTVTGTTTPVVDISSSYVGQSSITTLGTITTGTWNGTAVTGQYGGTGVNNSGKTITLGGNLTTSGAFATTFTSTATTTLTLPTTGTLATLAGSETFTNKSISGATNTIDNLSASNLASGTVPDARLQYVKSLLGGSYAATNTVAGSSTQYITAYGGYSNFNMENVRSYICPVAGTIRTLYAVTSTTQPANGSLIVSFRKNGVTQALTFTIAANAVAGTFSDLTHSFTVKAGDTISIEGINAATTASAAIISISALLTNF